MTDVPQGLFLLCYQQILHSEPVSGKTQWKQTHKTLVGCGFEACLGGQGSECLLLLPKSCVVTCVFDSLLRPDTLLRGDAEQTLEVSNLSRRQRARVQGKILTTTLASASSSCCFLSQTAAVWSWRPLRQCDPWTEKSDEVWSCLESAARSLTLYLTLLTPDVLEGKWLPLLVVDL